MSEPQVIQQPTGIEGLDQILRGGLPFIRRLAGAPPSASVLIKGRHGVGKTLLAQRLAAAFAKEAGDAIVVGCVEPLLTEIIAALSRFPWAPPRRVTAAGFEKDKPPAGAGPLLYVNSLVVPPPGNSNGWTVRAQIESWLQRVESAGFRVKAVVVDSLSEKYGLGGSQSRIDFADLVHVCAGRGLILILVQETAAATDDWLSFVPDVVMGLERSSGRRGDRILRVEKVRFAAVGGGANVFDIEPNGEVLVWPNLWSYDTAQTLSADTPFVGEPVGLPAVDERFTPAGGAGPVVPGGLLLVQGAERLHVDSVLNRYLETAPAGGLVGYLLVGTQVFVALSRAAIPGQIHAFEVGGLDRSTEEIVGRVASGIGRVVSKTGVPLLRLAVADLSALVHFTDADALGRGLLRLPRVLEKGGRSPSVLLGHTSEQESPFAAAVNTWLKLGPGQVDGGQEGGGRVMVTYSSRRFMLEGTVPVPLNDLGLMMD